MRLSTSQACVPYEEYYAKLTCGLRSCGQRGTVFGRSRLTSGFRCGCTLTAGPTTAYKRGDSTQYPLQVPPESVFLLLILARQSEPG